MAHKAQHGGKLLDTWLASSMPIFSWAQHSDHRLNLPMAKHPNLPIGGYGQDAIEGPAYADRSEGLSNTFNVI